MPENKSEKNSTVGNCIIPFDAKFVSIFIQIILPKVVPINKQHGLPPTQHIWKTFPVIVRYKIS